MHPHELAAGSDSFEAESVGAELQRANGFLHTKICRKSAKEREQEDSGFWRRELFLEELKLSLRGSNGR